MSNMDVLLVDDHSIVRDGLRHALEACGEVKCIHAASAEEALATLHRGLRPKVVVLDVSLPAMSGLEALIEIQKIDRTIPVLMLSMHPQESFAVRALRLGAVGYLNKSVPSCEIAAAVFAAAAGQPIQSSGLLTKARASGKGDGVVALHETLTPREFQVLRLLGRGKQPSDVARILELSVKTVSTHRERILQKLRLENNMSLIRYALEEGLLDDA